MNREYIDFLHDMRENAQRAIQFTAGMDYKSFAKDDKTVYAVNGGDEKNWICGEI